MARFNFLRRRQKKTVNLAGGEAFDSSRQLELVSLLLTTFVENKFYEVAEPPRNKRGFRRRIQPDAAKMPPSRIERLCDLIGSFPSEQLPFVGRAAIYARTQGYMRTITHVLVPELNRVASGNDWMRRVVCKTVLRPDDALEMAAYQTMKYGRPFPNALRRGLRDCFEGTEYKKPFDAYQLAKYRGSGKTRSLVDLFNLIRPKPQNQQQEQLFRELMTGQLRSKDTWESRLTQAGQEAAGIDDEKSRVEALQEAKAEVWSDLIKTQKIGQLALLRNLRNIIGQAPDILPEALELLVDKNRIQRSMILPFRYYTAYQQIRQYGQENNREVLVALSQALDRALVNVPSLQGKTLVVLDESGSMVGRPLEIGAIFASILFKVNNADLLTFSEEARWWRLNPLDSTVTIAETLINQATGGGTNFHAIFQTASQKYDRIIILSDMQGWIGYDTPTAAFAEFKKRTGAEPFIFSFDLNGYGTLMFPENKVCCLAGWSEQIFEIMKLVEQDPQAMIGEIDKIEL